MTSTIPHAPAAWLARQVRAAAAGLPFRIGNWVDFVVTRARGHRTTQLHCRTLTQWTRALRDLRFQAQAMPMSQGTPFANVLLVARAATAPTPA